MARYVLVSTNTADKVIKDGPCEVNPAAVPAAPSGRQWAAEATALSGGWSYPAVVLTVEETNAASLRDRAAQALAANAAFLALASPTNAQVLAQVQRLTKECSALIRLGQNLLDTTDGT